ncbi:MAG TPA: hypothetical protein VI814_09775 [Candidatus Limnocylindria bacterium]
MFRRVITALALALFLVALLPTHAAAATWSATYAVQPEGPTTLVAQTTTTFVVTTTNTGTSSWLPFAPDPIDLSYHLYDANGRLVVWDGIRTPITAQVDPGQPYTYHGEVLAPSTPGTYYVQFAFVDEGHQWFPPEATTHRIDVVAQQWSGGVTTTSALTSLDSTSASVPVAVTNTSNVTWAYPWTVRLAYHWYDASGALVVWDGVRTDPGRLAPGATATVNAIVDAPLRSGTYTLVFALVNEGVAWIPTSSPSYQVIVTKQTDASFQYDASALTAGAVIRRPLTITNTGGASISSLPLTISWLDAQGRDALAPYRRDIADLAPGASLTLYDNLQVPLSAGAYTLVFDLGGGIVDSRAVTIGAPSFPVTYSLGPVPTTGFIAQTVQVQLSVTNNSSSLISASGCCPEFGRFHASYHWIDSSGRVAVWDGGRSYVPGFGPGDTTSLTLAVQLPDRPGTYTLVPDLVEEGVAWFGAIGPRVTVTVENGLGAAYDTPDDLRSSVFAPGAFTSTAWDMNVTNTGVRAWDGREPIHCAYHIYDEAGNLLVWDGARSQVGSPPSDGPYLGGGITTGGRVACGSFDFTAPSTPGTYVIEFDMVYEGHFWFSQLGVPTHRDTFSVVPPAS